MAGRRVRMQALLPLWRASARRVSSLASRLPGTNRLVLRTSLAVSERNQARQLKPPQPPPTPHVANEDASSLPFSVETGTYRMIPMTGDELANENTWLVKIALLSAG